MENNNRAQRILSGDYPDEVYRMDYKKIGKCIILNHKKYQIKGLPDRPGTEDVNALRSFFERYKFDVEVHHDKSVDEINEILIKAKDEDHNYASCFVLCVLTHGDLNDQNKEILYACDFAYPTENLFSFFFASSCKSLAGKPKLFFIQACRGSKYDEGVKLALNPVNQTDSENSEHSNDIGQIMMCCRTPLHEDFFIAYSTVRGNVSWRRTGQGSWFIQILCETLEERADYLDLASILTKVCWKISYKCESKTLGKANMMKQVPSVYSTLRKRFEFPKNYSNEVYSLNYKKMGKCIILCHRIYSCGLSTRDSSEADAYSLKRLFSKYKFNVEMYFDLKVEKIHEILKKTTNEDHRDESCFVLCVLTHGGINKETNEEILFASDFYYSTENLFSTVLGDNCPSLAGKPKLFFVQACKETSIDFYKSFNERFGTLLESGLKDTGESSVYFKIPSHADYLITYATMPEYTSWRKQKRGSGFIRTLCETLEERVENLDLMSILTIVCAKVADESKPDPVPSLYFTLTKKFEFPKNEIV